MSRSRILLGLDPGFASFGWALLHVGRHPGEDVVLGADVIHTEKSAKKREVRASDDNVRRTRALLSALTALVDEHEPFAFAAESFSPPRHASNAAKVAFAWGMVTTLAHFTHDGLPVLQCSPQELKLAVCGSRSASKQAIEDALAARYPGARTTLGKIRKDDLEHVWDAVGAAHACLDTEVVRMARGMR